MNDHELRCNLNDHNVIAGPVIGECFLFFSYLLKYKNEINKGHTRAIYQRKLLEVITNENSEGKID